LNNPQTAQTGGRSDKKIEGRNGAHLSKEAISLFAKRKRASTSRREHQNQARKKQFDKEMNMRKQRICMMPRTVFDFKMQNLEHIFLGAEESHNEMNPAFTQTQSNLTPMLSFQQP